MEKNEKMKGTFITGVIGEDVHCCGIRILEHAMRDAGYKVVSLGVQISQEEFVNAALETNADAILVSSLSGHAKILIPGLRDKMLKSRFKKYCNIFRRKPGNRHNRLEGCAKILCGIRYKQNLLARNSAVSGNRKILRLIYRRKGDNNGYKKDKNQK